MTVPKGTPVPYSPYRAPSSGPPPVEDWKIQKAPPPPPRMPWEFQVFIVIFLMLLTYFFMTGKAELFLYSLAFISTVLGVRRIYVHLANRHR